MAKTFSWGTCADLGAKDIHIYIKFKLNTETYQSNYSTITVRFIQWKMSSGFN